VSKYADIKRWATNIGLRLSDAIKLAKLSDELATLQEYEHNTGIVLPDADTKLAIFTQVAARCGFSLSWPGIYPMLHRRSDKATFMLPETESSTLVNVEIGSTTRWYFVSGVDNNYVHVGEGRWVAENTLSKIPFGAEKITGADILDDFTRFIPGVEEVHEYGSLNLKIELDCLEEAGWSENDVITYMTTLAMHLQQDRAVISEHSPSLRETVDPWGTPIVVTDFYHFVVPEHCDIEHLALVQRRSQPVNAY
jgi:hypothetical protein